MKSKTESESLPLVESEQQDNTLARHHSDSPSVGQMLAALIEKGDPEKNIGVVERLIALQERQEAKKAERAFSRDFHALQKEATGVQALDEVPDRNGGVKYCFATYERIMEQVKPLLIKHGFSVTFDSEFKENRLIMRCILMHVDGHKTTTTQYMRVSAPYGANDSQADGATTTMAKRYALCSALNIVIEKNGPPMDDGKNEGQPIDFAQAQTLRELVKETGSDEKKFLQFAQAERYEDIGSARYQELYRTLQNKLRK